MKYLLDSNVFIESYQRFYAPDICPGFWDWLDHGNRSGFLVSMDKIREELTALDDDLQGWASARGEDWFLPSNEAMTKAFGEGSTWVHNKTFNNGTDYYELQAKNQFLGCADYYLVSFALGNGMTVVTQETHGRSAKRVKIPTACEGVSVKCINMYQLFRERGFKLRTCRAAKCESDCHSFH